MMTRRTKSRQAFTLVEVLVSIAVIAVLISLSVPVLQNALSKSRSAACASNLRQLGVAFQLYAADNHGYFPAARFRDPYVEGKNPSQNFWQVEIRPGNGWDLRYRRVNIQNPATAILAGDNCAYHLILKYGGFEKDASLPGGYRSTHPDRHIGEANYLFVDGQVESLVPEEAQELLSP